MITRSSGLPYGRFGRAVAAMAAAGALALTAGCGGGDGARPSTASLEKAISGGSDSVFGSSFANVSKKGLDCIAKALHDSKLSDTALRAIVEKKGDYKPNKTDEAAMTSVQSELMKCASSLTQ